MNCRERKSACYTTTYVCGAHGSLLVKYKWINTWCRIYIYCTMLTLSHQRQINNGQLRGNLDLGRAFWIFLSVRLVIRFTFHRTHLIPFRWVSSSLKLFSSSQFSFPSGYGPFQKVYYPSFSFRFRRSRSAFRSLPLPFRHLRFCRPLKRSEIPFSDVVVT